MLKVEPRFRLDRGYKGPYRVNKVTPTNAAIQMMNDPSAEPLIVSLQHLSLCNSSFSSNTEPCRGHYKSRRRCRIRRPLQSTSCPLAEARVKVYNQLYTRTRWGREVRRPGCYCLAVEGPVSKGEGSCKDDHKIRSREQPRGQQQKLLSRTEPLYCILFLYNC